MKYYIYILLFTLLSCSSQREIDNSQYIVLEKINVIDVVNGRISNNLTVVIKDSIIHFIGAKWKISKLMNVEFIDCSDKYLLPSFWDIHFHLCWEKDNDSLLFSPLLSNGITGIRDMGGDLMIQKKIKNSTKIRPHIFGAGPIIDGNPPVMYDFSIPVDGKTNIPKLLDSLANKGTDFIKTYSLIREPELRKIANFTKENNLSFAGHLSEYIDPEISIRMGQKSIEHLNRLDNIWDADSIRFDKIVDEIIKNKTWVCPTLIIYHNKANMNDPSIINYDYENYIHPTLAEEWKRYRENKLSQNDNFIWLNEKKKFEVRKKIVSHLNSKGVKILAGSDFAGMPYVYPGIGLLQELKLLNEAGLTNLEVLKTATINPAEYFSISDKYGSVTTGKIADLIILNKNPLEDIENVKDIELVFRKGNKIKPLLPTMYKKH